MAVKAHMRGSQYFNIGVYLKQDDKERIKRQLEAMIKRITKANTSPRILIFGDLNPDSKREVSEYKNY